MKNLIVANWKMNPASLEEAKNIFSGIKNGVEGTNNEIVICPPFVYLAELKGTALGAQNIFYEEQGAFTGEVSGEMLKNLGVEYVIIGHSERRKLGETNEMINKKIKKALEVGLKVIFCIGETAEEREAGRKNEVLERQIKIGLKDIKLVDLGDRQNINIAYEPVWAIGTGNNCGVEETKKSIDFIKNLVPNARVLYGGSVKSENSGDYIKNAGANGLLVGGASLNAEEFVKIVKSAE
ncbi:MAG: triose-phosphate isomerase [Candidatus Staskawiczbacteria bacterium]|nr:triose-phosphate isomerase [Candidatus Staskawiczbacteria bacterium]